MRIGVIGLGAIGGVVARRLSERAPEHALGLAAGRHAAAVAEEGLFAPPVRVGEGLPEASGPYDLILLCTRTDATGEALRPAARLLSAEGAVVCLQNGLPEAQAAAIVGEGRVLGAVIGWSASAEVSPRPRWWVTGGGKFTLGAVSREGERHLPAAASALEKAFPVRVTHNLAGARWSKLAMNCAMSTLGAVSGLDLGQLAARRDARTAALRIVAEVVTVARAKGVRLERIAGLDPAWLARGGPLAHALVWLGARRRPRQRSGMLVRLQQGRTAGQVDDLNGAVAREGGRAAPLNARLCALVHAIERGEERIGPGQIARLLA